MFKKILFRTIKSSMVAWIHTTPVHGGQCSLYWSLILSPKWHLLYPFPKTLAFIFFIFFVLCTHVFVFCIIFWNIMLPKYLILMVFGLAKNMRIIWLYENVLIIWPCDKVLIIWPYDNCAHYLALRQMCSLFGLMTNVLIIWP
jgi:hypothetical protein